MKKILMSLIVFIMLLTTISFAETKAKINVTAIRIRESASTDSKVVTNVYKDDEVEILEENGEWTKIKYGENIGYTKTEFLTKVDSTQKSNPSSTEKKSNYAENQVTNNSTEIPNGNSTDNVNNTEDFSNTNAVTEPLSMKEVYVGDIIISKAELKIRRIPNFSAKENKKISEGENLIIVSTLGNWCKISDGTNAGWILKNRLFQEKETEKKLEGTTEVIDNTTTQATESTEPVEKTVSNNTSPENEVTDNTSVQNNTQTNTTDKENTESKSAVVIVETARVRQTPSTKGEVIGTLDEDEVVNITGEEGEFYKISTNYLKEGYVSKKLLKIRSVTSRSLNTERTIETDSENTISEEANAQLTEIFEREEKVDNISEESIIGGSRKNELVEFAKQYLGYSYVSGGHSPETGFDCSGFTRYIFGYFGYSLGATAASQNSLGIEVAREDLQVADLILYYDEGMTKIGHVGIYIGDGNFIHSANPKRGVVIDNLNTNSYYSKRFVTARRIVE